MFEGWAADVLASYLGRFVNVQKDKLRISLWGGEGILENVQLRVEAFDYLQLPFAIKEGSIGRLKLQIPWGRWTGGPLVVELSDVILCITARPETDWEEGPASRRAQAAKQAQLAAAELAKLGSRVAATGTSQSSGSFCHSTARQQQEVTQAAAAAADAAAAAVSAAQVAAGASAVSSNTSSSWLWTIVDYIASFMLNRLQFSVKNVHVYFQAPTDSSSEYDAFGFQLASLATVAPGKQRPAVLSAFSGFHAPDSWAAKIMRQLHVQGWSCYWKPERRSTTQQQYGQQDGGASSAAGDAISRQAHEVCKPHIKAQDYLFAPVEAVLQATVNSSSSGSSSAGALSCTILIGAPDVAMQLSSQQLAGMARLLDDAAVWAKRNQYGRYRPPGWVTVLQALQRKKARPSHWGASNSTDTPTVQTALKNPALRQQQRQQQPTNARSSDSNSSGGASSRPAFVCSAGGGLVPTGRTGQGAAVLWWQVWQYAVKATMADLRAKCRQEHCWTPNKRDLKARRRYVKLYQQKLDALQTVPADPAEEINSSSAVHTSAVVKSFRSQSVFNSSKVDTDADSSVHRSMPAPNDASRAVTADSTDRSDATGTISLIAADSSAANNPPSYASAAKTNASASAACKAVGGSAAAAAVGTVTRELQRLEQELEVDDILLCRSLAEKAVDRRNSLSTEAERCRSWFAWGTSGISSFLYPYGGSSSSRSSRGSSGGGSNTAMPTDKDLNELLALLHGRQALAQSNSSSSTATSTAAGIAAAATTAAAAMSGSTGVDAVAAGTGAATATAAAAVPAALPARAPAVSINWQLLRLRAVLQDCADDAKPQELLVFSLQGISIEGRAKGHRLSAQITLQEGQLYDCCSDPGVHECVLQRLDPYSPVVTAAGLAATQLSIGSKATRVGPEALKQPLLAIGFEMVGPSKHLNLQLQQLQLLARPGCVVGVKSMLQHLPIDTLARQQAKAAALLAQAAQGHKPETAVIEAGKQPEAGNKQRAGLLQVQLAVQLHGVLVVVPTELSYTDSLAAVVHLEGLRLGPYNSSTEQSATSTDGSTAASEGLYNKSSSSSNAGSSDTTAHDSTCSTGSWLDEPSFTAVGVSSTWRQQQPCQQFAFELGTVAISVQRPISGELHQQPLVELKQLLQLPPIQGRVTLSCLSSITGSAALGRTISDSAADKPCSSAAEQQGQQQLQQQQPQLLVSLEVPATTVVVYASVVAALQQITQAVVWQMKLPLSKLVRCYSKRHDMQAAALAASAATMSASLQQHQQPGTQGASIAVVTGSSSQSSCTVVSAAAAASPAGEHSTGMTQQQQQQRPRRCDSDGLLQSMSHQPHQAPSQQLGSVAPSTAPAAAAEAVGGDLPDVPDAQLVQLELLLAGFNVQYVYDAHVTQKAEQRTNQHWQGTTKGGSDSCGSSSAISSIQLHVQLLLSSMRVTWQQSRQALSAEVSAEGLVVQNLLSADGHAAAAPSAPAAVSVVRLFQSLSLEQLQVAWQRHLLKEGVAEQTQVALAGLQVQGGESSPGLFLMPAHALGPTKVSVSYSSHNSNSPSGQGSTTVTAPKVISAAPTVLEHSNLLVQLHNIGLGLDGILELVAIIQAASSKPSGAESSTSDEGSTEPSNQIDRQQTANPEPSQQATQQKSLGLRVQVSQCHILSCRAMQAEPGVRSQPSLSHWGTSVPVKQSHSPELSGCYTSPADATCDLLLALPLVKVALQPASAAAQDGQATAANSRLPSPGGNKLAEDQPMVALSGLVLYLPEAIGSQILLPVLRVPSVIFRQYREPMSELDSCQLQQQQQCEKEDTAQGIDDQSQQQKQQSQQSAEVGGQVPQAGESDVTQCSNLHIPAIGASLRPTQLQHMMQLVTRLTAQQQQWAAGSVTPQTGDTAKQQRQRQQQKQQNLQQTGQQLQHAKMFKVAIDDMQVLLLPTSGTSDHGILLQWQQLLVRHTQQSVAAAAAASSNAEVAAQVVAVSWCQLTVQAVQQAERGASADLSPQPAGTNAAQQWTVWIHASTLPALQCMQQRPIRGSKVAAGPMMQAGAARNQPSAPSIAAGSTAQGMQVTSTAAGGSKALAVGGDMDRHATLSRYFSSQNNWHPVGSCVSDVFFSPHNSSMLASGSTSGHATNSSSNLASRLAEAAAATRGTPPFMTNMAAGATQQSPMLVADGVAAKGASQIQPASSIIAASWSMEPPGSPPQGTAGVWRSSTGLADTFSSAFRQQQTTAALDDSVVMPAAQSGQTQKQQQQQAGFGQLKSRSSSTNPTPFSSSRSNGRRSLALHEVSPQLHLSSIYHSPQSSQMHGSFRTAASQSIGFCSQSLGSRWLDEELEFFSIAGDSSADEGDAVAAADTGVVGSSPHTGAAGASAGDDGWQMLPMAACWPLLSLKAVGGASGSADNSTAVTSKPSAAVTINISSVEMDPACTADDMQQSQHVTPQQQVQAMQHVSVEVLGWYLLINGTCWDKVAPCLVQAITAVSIKQSEGTNGQPQRHEAGQQQQQSQQQQGSLRQGSVTNAGESNNTHDSWQSARALQLHADVQRLQAALFLPPDAAAGLQSQKAVPSEQQQPGAEGSQLKTCHSYGPWQDPEASGSPTAAQAVPKTAPATGYSQTPAARQQRAGSNCGTHLAAETLTLTITVSAWLASCLQAGDRVAAELQQPSQQPGLQQMWVPSLSVSLGAMAWDAATGQPVIPAPDAQQQLTLLHISDTQIRAKPGTWPGQEHYSSVSSAAAGGYALTDRALEYSCSTGAVQSVPSGRAAAAVCSSMAVSVGSISGWVSTTRLALLINMQQQLLQQVPAVIAAAAVAGPFQQGSNAAGTAAADGEAVCTVNGEKAAALAMYKSAMSIFDAVAVDAPGPGNSIDSTLSAISTASCSCYSVAVQKVAVLCSNDEPETTLLQHQHSSTDSPAVNSSNSPAAAAAAASPVPLLEVAMLPLKVQMQVSKQPTAAAVAATSRRAQLSSRSCGSVSVDVAVSGCLLADVYNVDKLGWEPFLDPWPFQVTMGLGGSAAAVSAASNASKQSMALSLDSSSVLEATVAPSAITSATQLQRLIAAAHACQADAVLLQRLLHSLAAASSNATVSSGDTSCWLLNQMGMPVSYVVADAAVIPAAIAAPFIGSSPATMASSSGAAPGTCTSAEYRGQVAHQMVTPLSVVDMAAAGYCGQYVDWHFAAGHGSSSEGQDLQHSSIHRSAANQANAKRPQLLYLRAAGHPGVIGPIALEQLGQSIHTFQGLGFGTPPPSNRAAGSASRRQQQGHLVIEVSRHRHGGRLVSLHSSVQLANKSGLALQLGCLPALGLGGPPVELETVPDGGSVWLPLQVLQSAAATLCIRPAGLTSAYSWCTAIDVITLLQRTTRSNSSNGTAGVSNFWYAPPSGNKQASQTIFFPQRQESAASLQGPAGTTAAGAGVIVLSLGCRMLSLATGNLQPAAADARVPAAPSTSTSAASGLHSCLWQLAIEPPAVFVNELPVPINLSIVAGQNQLQGLHAIVASRQSLPLYGSEAPHVAQLQLRPHGYNSSAWVHLRPSGATAASSATHGNVPWVLAAAQAAQAPQKAVAGLQRQSQQQLQQHIHQYKVSVTAVQADQPPLPLRFIVHRSTITGSVTITVSCSLWLFNCLGFQVAIRPVKPAHSAAAAAACSSCGNSRGYISPLFASVAGTAASAAAAAAEAAAAEGLGESSNKALWLQPYPWLLGSATGLSADIVASQAAGSGPTTPWATAADAAALGAGSSSAGAGRELGARSVSSPALPQLGLGTLQQPSGFASQAVQSRLASASSMQQQPQATGGLGMRRSISTSCLQSWQLLDTATSIAAADAAAAAVEAAAALPLALGQLSAAVRGTELGPSGMGQSVAELPTPASNRRRPRRHSSGLHKLMSGKLPDHLLLPQLQQQLAPGPGKEVASEVDLLSPTHQQRLQQLQQQQVGCVADVPVQTQQVQPQLLVAENGPVIRPVLHPNAPDVWLPLLAAGDLNQLAAISAAAPGARFTAGSSNAVIASTAAAAAAAATDRLLDVLHADWQQNGPQGMYAFSSSAQGELALPTIRHGGSHHVSSFEALPAVCGWPEGWQQPNSSSTGSAAHDMLPGSISAAGLQDSGSMIELQLCAAPAAMGLSATGRGVQQLASNWSLPAKLELQAGKAGPAGVVKLPLMLPSTLGAVGSPRGGLAANSSSAGLAAAVDQGLGGLTSGLRSSLSSATLASHGSSASTPTAVTASQRAQRWGARSQGAQLQQTQQQGVCYVSVYTEPVVGSGGAHAVHLLPTYMLINTLSYEVHLRQYGSEIILQTVAAGGHCCVLWPDATLPLKLQFRVAKPGWSWSGAAAIDSPGELLVKVRQRNSGETLLLQLDVAAASTGSSIVAAASTGSSIVATLSGRRGGFAPYRIDNCSCEVIHVQQAGCVEQEDVLQPYSSLPWSWDEPSHPHKVLLFLPGHRKLGEFFLEKVGQLRQVARPGSSRNHLSRQQRTLLITTEAEGPTKVLRVLDMRVHLLQQPTAGPGTGAAAANAGKMAKRSSSGSIVEKQQVLRRQNTLDETSNSSNNSLDVPAGPTTGSTSKASGFMRMRGTEQQLRLRRLAAFLGLDQHTTSSSSGAAAVNISHPNVEVQVQLQGVGMSLVSDTSELLYSCCSNIQLRACQDDLRSTLGLMVGSVRADNTLYSAKYPSLLACPVSRAVFGIVYPHSQPMPAAQPAINATEAGHTAVDGADREVAETSCSNTATDGTAAVSGSAAASIGTDGSASTATVAEADIVKAGRYIKQSHKRIDTAAVKHQQGSQLHRQQLQQPALGVLATTWRSRPSDVLCVQELALLLAPVAINLEGKHLRQLVKFATSIAAAGSAADMHQPLGGSGSTVDDTAASIASSHGRVQPAAAAAMAAILPPVRSPSLPAAAAASKRLKLYFEDWHISAVTLCISFAPESWFDTAATSKPVLGGGTTAAAAVAATSAAATAAVAAVAAGADVGDVLDTVEAQATSPGSAQAADANGSNCSSTALQGPQNTEETGNVAAEGHGWATSAASSTSSSIAAAANAAASCAATAAAGGIAEAQLPVWLQMAVALAHAEEGAWITLGAFRSSHTMFNTDALIQVLGRHYILAAYQELPKVLASLDILGDPARLLQALGLGFWHLVTLPAHSARRGPLRSLQRLMRGVRVVAYGISNSIAKGSRRSKAALLPLVPAGLEWQQLQQQQLSGLQDWPAHRASLSALQQQQSQQLQASSSGSSSSRSAVVAAPKTQGDGGHDLLHVLVAGYSLTFQQMLRSIQSGQPLRGALNAAMQTVVLPVLLLLEMAESTASSFKRLFEEQHAGQAPVRIPRYVAAGQLLKQYSHIDSLGRALLQYAPGPYLAEDYMGCAELQQGWYAVVTLGHMLLLHCHVAQLTAPAGATQTVTAGSVYSSDSAATAAIEHKQQQSNRQQQQQQQQQRQPAHVHYKDAQLLLVLDIKDIMMITVEGSDVRLLCMAGGGRQASQSSLAAAPAAIAVEASDASRLKVPGQPVAPYTGWAERPEQRQLSTTGSMHDSGVSGLLRAAATGTALQQQRSVAHSSIQPAATTAALAALAAEDSSRGQQQQVSPTSAQAESPLEVVAANTVLQTKVSIRALAGSEGVVGDNSSIVVGSSNALVVNSVKSDAGGFDKWFVGHTVPCDSAKAAQELQQLLQRACQRLDSLIATSAWQRQVLL